MLGVPQWYNFQFMVSSSNMHEFVIADQITSEAILGLYFLEANKCVLDLANEKI